MQVSHVAECPDLGPECADHEHPPVPYNHHVSQLMFETAVEASLGITSVFAIDTRWAFRVADINPTYSELDGTPKEVPNDIHHHDETLVDVLDPWLLLRFAKADGDFVGAMRVGGSFPLGRTEEDPYRLGQQGKSHEHLQGGTGTFVPIVGFGMAYTYAPVTFGLGGTGFFNAYENDEGYRAPVRVYLAHRVTVAFLDDKLRPSVGLDLAHEGEELWHGEPGLEGSNVRTELFTGGGIAYTFFDPWTADLTVRFRVASLTEAPTFEVPVFLNLGVSTTFDLWGAEPAAAPSSAPGIIEEEKGGVTTFEKD